MKKPTKRPARAIVAIRLPPKLIKEIARVAQENGVSKTQVIETALYEYLSALAFAE